MSHGCVLCDQSNGAWLSQMPMKAFGKTPLTEHSKVVQGNHQYWCLSMYVLQPCHHNVIYVIQNEHFN